MSSKQYIKYFLVGVLALNTSGCSEFIHGKKAEPEVIELSDKKLACLQVVPNQLRSFVSGEAHDQDIRTSFDCLADALRYFNKRTFSSANGAYTSEEMRNFFGKYFLKENNVSPEFAFELMKIKKALVGGSTRVITKDEIQQLVLLLEVVRNEFVLLSPHMKILAWPTPGLNETPVKWSVVNSSLDQLRSTLKKLLESTQLAQSDYSFADLKKAVVGLEEFVQIPENQATLNRYSSVVPLIEAVKNVFMGRRAQFIHFSDWEEGLNTFVDLFELVLKYRHTLQGITFDSPAQVQKAVSFVESALRVLGESPQLQNQGYIPVSDLDDLVDKAVPLFLPRVSAKSIKRSYRAVLMKILNSQRSSEAGVLLGLERKHFLSLLREFNIWRHQQAFIDSLKMDRLGGGVSQKELLQIYKAFSSNHNVTKEVAVTPIEETAVAKAWEDFGDQLNQEPPVVFNGEGRLVISTQNRLLKQSWASLTKANLMRALARMLMLGYGENTGGRITKAQLLVEGLSDWYDDFNDLGIELKAFDRRTGNAGKRSFMEANFFTFSGNGDQVMDYRETFQFVSTLFSGGLSISEDLRQHMENAGCNVESKDSFDYPYVQEKCFKDELRKNISIYFNNLPGLVQYVRSLTPVQWNEFYKNLFASSLVEDQKTGLVETANIRTMVIVLHYVEAVMVLFDRDQSQGLSLKEVKAAAPRFMSFIKTIKPIKSETLLTEGFAHLVFKGTIPDLLDLGEFQIDKIVGLSEAQRLEIVRLFGTLKEQLKGSP